MQALKNNTYTNSPTGLRVAVYSYIACASARIFFSEDLESKYPSTLAEACAYGRTDIVSDFIKNGSDVNSVEEVGEINIKLTPLMYAYKHKEIIIKLIDAGANPYFKVRGKHTILSLMPHEEHELILRKLMEIDLLSKENQQVENHERKNKYGI